MPGRPLPSPQESNFATPNQVFCLFVCFYFLPTITYLFLLPSAYESISFCTVPWSSSLSARLDAA